MADFGAAAGLSNMAVGMTFAALMIVVEQSCMAVLTKGKRERLQALVNEGKVPSAPKVDDSTTAYLQGIQYYCLVCLFGILFASISTPFVSGQRLLATKELTYALVVLSLGAVLMGRYVLNLPFGLTKGERSTRKGMLYILLAFQMGATYLVLTGGDVAIAEAAAANAAAANAAA